MATFLTLGPVVFDEWETPRSIPFPVGQQLVVQKLPGGSRTVDAMGRDDKPIRWSGRFRGPSAEIRARQLHDLAAAGGALTLSWSTLSFLVVIDDFDPNFERPTEIPYSISCEVISDLSSPLLSLGDLLDGAIGADGSTAASLSDDLDIPSVSTAVDGLTTLLAGIPTLQGAGSATILQLQEAIGTAQAATTASITSLGAATAANGTVGGVYGGGDPVAMASALAASASAFTALPQLYNLQASLGRMSVNLAN